MGTRGRGVASKAVLLSTRPDAGKERRREREIKRERESAQERER